ncbi:MAG: CBS domain-containing protein [Candidatus Binatia bacterium]
MVAKDIMTRDVITASPSLSVKELAMLMIKNQISGLPVADESGKIVGLVSEADIIGKKGKQVQAIMSREVFSVTEDASIEQIAQLMTTHRIKRVPVMNDGRLVGIVSRADIVNTIAMGDNLALHTPVYDL